MPELNVDKVRNRWKQDDSRRLNADRKTADSSEEEHSPPFRRFSDSERQISSQEYVESLFGFHAYIRIRPQHGAQGSRHGQQKTHPRRTQCSKPKGQDSQERRSQQYRLQSEHEVRRHKNFPQLNKWKIEKNGNWPVA